MEYRGTAASRKPAGLQRGYLLNCCYYLQIALVKTGQSKALPYSPLPPANSMELLTAYREIKGTYCPALATALL